MHGQDVESSRLLTSGYKVLPSVKPVKLNSAKQGLETVRPHIPRNSTLRVFGRLDTSLGPITFYRPTSLSPNLGSNIYEWVDLQSTCTEVGRIALTYPSI